jgi:hypothetical protein
VIKKASNFFFDYVKETIFKDFFDEITANEGMQHIMQTVHWEEDEVYPYIMDYDA